MAISTSCSDIALPFLSRTGRAKILAMEDLRLLFMMQRRVVDAESAGDARPHLYGLVVNDCGGTK